MEAEAEGRAELAAQAAGPPAGYSHLDPMHTQAAVRPAEGRTEPGCFSGAAAADTRAAVVVATVLEQQGPQQSKPTGPGS